ncbi:hypothetical protein FB451DRAFT_95665 [Mycena latifolia]|nr:hypothetical protein FB451DRAFT_95665 [Mycena latifolia]
MRPWMRRGLTLPIRLVSPSSFSDETAYSNADGRPPNGTAEGTQPGTMTATVSVTAVSMEEKIWQTVSNPNGNVAKPEIFLNKGEDGVAASASNGIVATINTIAANEEVQEFGKAILSGVPALMSALEGLSKVHPFAAVAFLPFQFAYKQEMKRHDNEKSRLALFETIKGVMCVIVEMKGVEVTRDDKRVMPGGQPLVSRLEELGQQMDKDITECYNTLDAMQKQSLVVKFCKASGWNDKLADFKVRFKTRREELQLALTLNTATTIQDMSTRLKEIQDQNKKMHDDIMKEFQSFKTPQDRKIEAFFTAHGGVDEISVGKIMEDEAKCTMLLKLQHEQTTMHNIQSTYAAGPGRPRIGGAGLQEQDKQALAALRKEFRSDINSVIEENMESFSKRLDLSLHLLREDLKNDIHKEGDRVINFLKGGPHLRLKDKIMRQVWKDQGLRGSAKTRTLVLSLRDYLVERNEHADNDLPPPSATSLSVLDEEDVQDPETAMGVPLPDNWVLEYLQVRRLRNLQQVLDPDTSGFSTISEVNAFTQSRHPGWSLPRWISYWVVGWQIYATRYCTEIDNIFTEMLLIRDKVSMQMPGNKRYINDYISETWPLVIGLTSAIDRFEGTEWLADQFKEYIDAQETALRSRLARIHYDIDTSDTVHEILRGQPIERSIFMLIAIILRRHLLKMHLCLTTEMNDEEFYDDSYTVKFVVEAAWLRYNNIVELYKNQQIADMKQNFEWFSCGLFRKYFEWNEWTDEKYYRENQITSYSGISEIRPIKAEDLKGILLHELTPAMFNESCLSNAKSAAAATGDLPPAIPKTQAPTKPTPLETGEEATSASLSEIVTSLSGVWFGFHATEEGIPYTGMFYLKIAASIRPGQTDVITIAGEGSSFGPTVEKVGMIEGTATPTPNEVHIKVEFKQGFDSDEYGYQGIFALDLHIINGSCASLKSDDYRNGHFLLKKTPTDSIMCHRPLFPRPLNARELWSFACDAVVGELNRRKPSMRYFFRRMKMIKRCLELLHRPGEARELNNLRRAFTVQEYIEIQTLAGWYTRCSDLQPPLVCDSCGEFIFRSRVLCMECGPAHSVDFDAKEDCLCSSTLARDDLTTPHQPTHLLLKTRDVLFLMDYHSVKSRALNCSNLAAGLYSRARKVVGPAVADVGVSFSEVQPTSVAVTVEVAMPNEVSPPTLPPPTTSRTNNNNSSTEVPKACSDCSLEDHALTSLPEKPATNSRSEDSAGESKSNLNPAPAPALPGIGPDGTTSQLSPPAAVSDAGDTHGTTEGPNSEPTVTTADSEDNESITLNCLICHKRASAPCWYCIDCRQYDAFVCSACETDIERLYPWEYQNRYRKEARASSSAHNVLHMLIRFGNTEGKIQVEAAKTVESSENITPEQQYVDRRLREVEERLILRMEKNQEQVDQRLARIEALLQVLPSLVSLLKNDHT